MNMNFNKALRRVAAATAAATLLFITPASALTVSAATNTSSSTTATTSATTAATTSSWPKIPEDLVSNKYILMDADTGAILAEKGAYDKSYPASTTKILTGLLVAENNNLSDTVTFSSKAANSVTLIDSQLGTRAGEEMSVEQALYGLLLYSANELAYGLAEHTGGTLENFVDMMNTRAKAMGAKNTHFANASGLPDTNHYTTAYDMALIAKEVFNNPTFMKIDSTTYYEIPPTNKYKNTRRFNNRNLLLPGMKYGYEYCIGGKTGYTVDAEYTYVAQAEKNGMRLIFVCFQSTADGRFTDAKTLFEWGFNNFEKVSISDAVRSTVINSSDYYASPVLGSHTINTSLSSSYLTMPKSIKASDITMEKADSSDSTDNVQVNFKADGHLLGSGTLTLSSSATNALAGTTLPLASDSAASKKHGKFSIVINIWLVLIILGALFFYRQYRSDQDRKMKKEHYKRKYGKKVRYYK